MPLGTTRSSVVYEAAGQMTGPYLSPSCVQYTKILSYSSLAGFCKRVSNIEIDRHRHIADELKAEKMQSSMLIADRPVKLL